MDPKKVNVINVLQLIANVEEQDKYCRDVPIANVAAELICQWFDDFFHPESNSFKESFSDDEWKILMEFHHYYDGLVEKLPDNYEALREDFNWKQIVGKAAWALEMLGWRDLEAKYDD